LARGAPLQQDQPVAPAAIARPIPPQAPRANVHVVSNLLKKQFSFLITNKL
jgi:hypothetical protein